MTPLRGFLRRIKGDADAAPAPLVDPAVHDAEAGEAARKSRRGRRGGRGRGKGDSQPEAGTNAASTNGRREQQDTLTSQTTAREGTSTSRRGSRGGSRSSKTDAKDSTQKPEGSRTGNGRSGRPSKADTGGTGTSNDQPKAYSWGRKVGDDNDARQELDDRRRKMDRRRRGFRPSRDRLDQPLPEDIAFRAADEGGDRSILPARRRRPKGLRTTERVLMGGTRLLTGFVRRPVEDSRGAPDPRYAEPPHEMADELAQQDLHADDLDLNDAELPEADEADLAAEELDIAPLEGEVITEDDTDTAADEDPDAPKRRRRGRRGGRGRRRPTAESNGGTPEAADVADEQSEDLDAVDQADLEDVSAPATEAEIDDEPEDEPAAPRRRRAPRSAAPKIDPADYPEAFRALGLSDRSLATMASFGFTAPSPIQERAIPALLRGDDVVGIAQTGSGKTVAFGVPMVERLDAERREVQGIVLVPTRELAQQVLDVLADLGRPYGLEAVGLLGGRALNRDFAALDAKPHIVVGTPGRIIDHLQRGTLSLRAVSYAVLDEADQMLDIGFLPDIRRILGRTPRSRQTALFSATMPTTIKRLVWQFMREPETVSVDPDLSTVESVEQIYFEVASRDKTKGLRELVERELKGRTLVFCKMKRGVDRLAANLEGAGVRVGALHGDMDQRKRDQVVQRFRKGDLDVLIATNVAARGLDIPEITHVVNFDVPQNAEEYVHRIGRTGRAGRDGKAITFVSEIDLGEFDTILQEFGDDLRRERLDLYS